MEIMDALKGRQSVKKYDSTPVEPEKLEQILEAGRLAPSAYNSQCRRFIVLTDPSVKKKIRECAKAQPMVEEAPVVVVMCATPDVEFEDQMPCGEKKHPIDIALSGAYMMLEAYGLGLGSCWLGAFDGEAVKRVLGIPDPVKVVTMIPFGYHDGSQPRKGRKPLEEIVSYNSYCLPSTEDI